MRVYLLEESYDEMESYQNFSVGTGQLYNQLILHCDKLDTYFVNDKFTNELVETTCPWYFDDCKLTYVGNL